MRHGLLPRTLHVDEPSPHVDWTSGRVELLTEDVEWPAPETPAPGRGVVVRHQRHQRARDPGAAPTPAPRRGEPRRTAGAARAVRPVRAKPCATQAVRLREHLSARLDAGGRPALSLVTGRSAFEHRAVVLADGDRFGGDRAGRAGGRRAVGVRCGRCRRRGGQDRVPVLRPGRPADRHGPRAVRAVPGVRRRRSTRCAPRFDLGWWPRRCSTAESLDRDGLHAARAVRARGRAVPAARVVGRAPDFVAGHSIGELAAAHVAGVLSLADACTLVAARGRLMAGAARGRRDGRRAGDRGRGRAAARSSGVGPRRGQRGRRRSSSPATKTRSLAVAAELASPRAQDQAAQRVARVPLGADGADAGRLPAVVAGLTFPAPRRSLDRHR